MVILSEWQGATRVIDIGLQKGNKPATINRHIATIKHMFTKAVEWDMVEEEVLKRIRKVKLLEENNRRLRYLSQEECHNLIGACNDNLKPIVICALNSGMRRSEILNLKWADLEQSGEVLKGKGKRKSPFGRE